MHCGSILDGVQLSFLHLELPDDRVTLIFLTAPSFKTDLQPFFSSKSKQAIQDPLKPDPPHW